MLLNLFIVIICLVILALSADKFVNGASAIAKQFGVSPLLIGLTIVAFGTSAPEMFVSASAALNNNPSLAIGNAIGSNIANIALVLGLAIVFAPQYLHVDKQIVRKEMPIMLGVTIITCAFFIDSNLSFFESILLLIGLALFVGYAIYSGKKETSENEAPAIADLDPEKLQALERMSPFKAWALLLGGLLFMALSSRGLVISASSIARDLGVSDLVIGLTIVAIGTSLPEVAASVVSSLKKETELAMGNVIGSNIFNLLAVIGIAGVIEPTPVESAVLYRDAPILLLMTVLLFVLIKPWNLLSKHSHKTHHLGKFVGYLLLISYFAYLALILYTS